MDFQGNSDVHGRGVGVVGALRLVDMVVRVNRLLGPEATSHDLDGPVGDHLVGVHVALGARTRLPDD